MLRLLADENFNNAIVRGVWRRNPAADLVRVQDVGLSSAADPTVLAWAADAGRILLTHDVTTITKYAYDRIAAGQTMPGVVEVSRAIPIGMAIENIVLLIECSVEGEWEGQVLSAALTRIPSPNKALHTMPEKVAKVRDCYHSFCSSSAYNGRGARVSYADLRT